MQSGILSRSDGSCKLEFGNTAIICAVNGPMEPLRKDELHDRAFIDCVFTWEVTSKF